MNKINSSCVFIFFLLQCLCFASISHSTMVETTFSGNITHVISHYYSIPTWEGISTGDEFTVQYIYDDDALSATDYYSATGEIRNNFSFLEDSGYETFSDVNYTMTGSLSRWIEDLPSASGGVYYQWTYIVSDRPSKRYFNLRNYRTSDLRTFFSFSTGQYSNSDLYTGIFDWGTQNINERTSIFIAFNDPETRVLQPVPEPATILLLGSGLLGLGWYGRKRKKA